MKTRIEALEDCALALSELADATQVERVESKRFTVEVCPFIGARRRMAEETAKLALSNLAQSVQ